ncbi:type II toxin-antitoxin system RelE/ParE family toxin [Tritonibacter scottomollicae]|nr:type II toxin-antitoxin system RelE/ParE family toxin [Tritonibacter scottomollicae]
MAKYKLTPKAEEDLKDIWRHIAQENEPAADRLLMRWFDKFELAAENPKMGVARPEIASDVRLLFEGNYVTLYEPASYGILVVAVVYGGRDAESWL